MVRCRYQSVIISRLVSVVNFRNRPALVALSVLLGVVLAGGGVVLSRGESSGKPISADPPNDVAYRATTTSAPVTPSPAPPVESVAAPTLAAESPAPPAAPPPTKPSAKASETPEPRPTTTPGKASTSAADSSVAGQMLALVNQQRASAGCGALTLDSRLTAAAQAHSDDMSARGYFSHTTPEGVTFDQRIKNAGYPRPGGENIAMGSATVAQTMTLWMNSDGHRRNILNCSFTALGVGLATSGWYWTQTFGF